MQEEWRVDMLPIEFLFLTVSPVIDMRLRCKSSGIGYPPGVPRDISKVLDLEIVSKLFNKPAVNISTPITKLLYHTD